MRIFISSVLVIFLSNFAYAQKVELSPNDASSWKKRAKGIKTGRKAAGKYMNRKVAALGGSARYLAIHLGTFSDSEAYRWGEQDSWNDKAKTNIGVTYRVGEWTNSMDLLFRAEFMSFDFDGEKPYKISMMPVIIFPDARSNFPLYFGAGLGAGIFLKQVSGESSISLDYNLLFGARFFDVIPAGGFFFEAGLKGHVHLLSSGQFNGTYLSGGMVFTF